ncbi:hypothetical protein DEU56DRAFT_920361 [Suillus clintonianus]|uniref:uncharacterized protein n=1 Tax=Suillus clintonianus TaxID=1904413 RepID=UPI001B8646DA|nr:uncharacterized protein DEU56DRAFT_920361 [Suillus clintonianus]KAG2109480.1 hypothetical protein DEU56DRAFT_920361 [Suillus clintonianus]
MSLPLLRFLQIPFDDIDFDNVVLSDPSLTESSNSPRLTASDEMVLNPAYWFSHPPRYRYLMQRISTLLPTLQASASSTEDQSWVAALFAKDVPAAMTPKILTTDGADSITDPESEDITVTPSISTPTTVATTTTIPPADDDSTTEPDSDAEIVTPGISTLTAVIEVNSGPCMDPGSTTESESDENVPLAAPVVPPHLDRLDSRSFFATPSPPPPDSIYWKYITREEDSKWYDRAGTDSSFSAVRHRKQELQALMDK